MALTLSAKLSVKPPLPVRPTRSRPYLHPNLSYSIACNRSPHPKLTVRRDPAFRRMAVEESGESEAVKGAEISEREATELGAEIKKAMMERKKEEKEGDELLSGVGEEIGEIEWPAFGKVLGTTGVVLGVIAGSSVVLLTVNAILAELSDKVFAGRGIQDFF